MPFCLVRRDGVRELHDADAELVGLTLERLYHFADAEYEVGERGR
jgi:hypothetical protein